MKTKYTVLLTTVLLFLSVLTKGQQSGSTSSENEKRAQNIFVELGGQGLLFTANYDTRFSNRRDGLGGRIGIGYIAEGGDNATTIPISMNYLLGKGRHFFEMGLGATLLATGGNDNSLLFDENNSNVIGTMSFSYRLQPVDRGFSFRAGLTPIFNKDFFIPYYAGLSLGYSF
jgi:hypothetical protein